MPALIDNVTDCIGEGAAGDPVHNDRANCNLSFVGLIACLTVDQCCKQVDIR